ncbi:hypothetical protein [Streptomyces sp. NPDC059881]|uniref:hypothetical protein n=1 Tax=Streptomyces sp. NPDC059881 TaxID=3346986 RepID=UPI0036475645
MKLGDFVRKFVTPALKAEGLIRVRGDFQISSENGDRAFIGFSDYRVDPDVTVFEVSYFMVPMPYWQWMTRQHAGPVEPDRSGALMTCRVNPPREVVYNPDGDDPFDARWCFKEGEEGECGRILVERLRGSVVPEMRRLLDRAALLDRLNGSSAPRIARLDPLMREVVLIVDSAPVDEVRRILSTAEGEGTLPAFIQWARRRLEGRAA